MWSFDDYIIHVALYVIIEFMYSLDDYRIYMARLVIIECMWTFDDHKIYEVLNIKNVCGPKYHKTVSMLMHEAKNVT